MPQPQPPQDSIRQTIRNYFRTGTLRSAIRDWKWILTFTKKHSAAIVFQTANGLLASALGLVSGLAGKYLIDSMVALDQQRLASMAAVLICTAVTQLLFQALNSRFSAKLNVTMQNDVHSHVFDRLIHSDWQAIRRYPTGDLLTRFTSDSNNVASCAVSMVPSAVIHLFTLTAVLAILLYYDPIMALIGCVSTPILFLASNSLIRHQRSYNRKMREASSRISAFESETFRNIDTLKGFAVEDAMSAQLLDWQTKFKSVALEYNQFHIQTHTLLSAMSSLVQYLAIGYCVIGLWQGRLNLGTMSLFLMLRSMLQSSFSGLIGLIPRALGGSVSAERIRELTQLDKDTPSIADLPTPYCHIRLENVSVCYEDGDEILRSISLTVKPGEVIALVGSSGEGKTTLLRLLLGLIRPAAGTMELEDARGEVHSLGAGTRNYFSYVPQGNTLLAGTIAENLRLVNPHASDEEIIAALEGACAWDFVSQLPDTIHTPLGEGGQGLSEGQAQRIAIARALLRKAPVMLLDEITSALDMTTEREVLDFLMHLGVTCIVSTHRPSVLTMCTSAYRVEEGRLTQLTDEEIRTLIAGM